MEDRKNIFERTLDRSRDFYQRILPISNRRKIITATVSSFILYTAFWISLALMLMSFGPLMIFSLIIVMIAFSFFTLVPMLSVAIENVKNIDSQSEDYRRDPKNKNKLFVNFGSEGWKEFSFGYPDTTKSFKKLAEKAGLITEQGGEDENQKKTRLRNNKIDDLLKTD